MSFVAPVLAERAHVAERAQGAALRRESGSAGARTLGEAVAAHLSTGPLRADTVEWDSWRRDDGRWTLAASFVSDARTGRGHFTYDMRGSYVVADDDDARWLVGDAPAPAAVRDDLQQARRRRAGAARERIAVTTAADPLRITEDFFDDVCGRAPQPSERGVLRSAYESALASARSER